LVVLGVDSGSIRGRISTRRRCQHQARGELQVCAKIAAKHSREEAKTTSQKHVPLVNVRQARLDLGRHVALGQHLRLGLQARLLVVHLLHRLQGGLVGRRDLAIDEEHVDVVGNGELAGGDGFQHATFAAAVGAEQAVAPAKVELEAGVGEQLVAVEQQGKRVDLDVARLRVGGPHARDGAAAVDGGGRGAVAVLLERRAGERVGGLVDGGRAVLARQGLGGGGRLEAQLVGLLGLLGGRGLLGAVGRHFVLAAREGRRGALLSVLRASRIGRSGSERARA
jgi:hypothetical protein